MKKEKKLLLISAIISILYLLISFIILLFTHKLIDNNNVVNVFNIIIYSLVIIGSIVFLYYSLSKVDIESKKKSIFFWSIILFINNIIGGILGFLVVKKINKNSLRKLPNLEILNNYKWYVYIFVFIIWCVGIFGLSKLFTKNIYYILMYLFFILLLGFIFRKDLKRDFNYFKKYFKEYSSIVLSMFGKSFVILIILSLSIKLYTGINNATNQVSLNEAFSKKPLFIASLALLYAPFVEELLFRGIIRKFINNKWLFILLSGFLFGAAHVIDDFQNIQELLYILVYSSLGCFFAATYYKTNNIFANMMFHFLQNFIAIIGMIIITFLPDIINLIR